MRAAQSSKKWEKSSPRKEDADSRSKAVAESVEAATAA
jgi:hypothetical protein